MFIKKLKEIIKDLPDSMEVCIDFEDRICDFPIGSVESARVRNIPYSEEPYGEELCREDVLVLSEDPCHNALPETSSETQNRLSERSDTSAGSNSVG